MDIKIKIIKFKWLLILILIFSIANIWGQGIEKINLDENLRINELSGKGDEFLFKDFSKVIENPVNGNLFLFDKESLEITKLDGNGKFLKRFGHRGRGPGEFLAFSYFTIIDGKIQVFDMFNRRFCYLSFDGEYIDSEKMDDGELPWAPSFSGRLDRDQILISGLFSGREDDDIFHLYDNEMNYKESFGNDVIKYFSNKLIDLSGIRSLRKKNIAIIDSATFIYSPSLYYGEMILMKKSLAGKWNKAKTLSGFVEYEEPYTEYDPDINNITFTINGHTGDRSYACIIHNQNEGIYILSSGELIHFTRISCKGKQVFGYEIFDKEFNFKGYKIIKEMKLDKNGFAMIPFGVKGKDSNDNFFFADYSSLPTLIRAKIVNYDDKQNK